MSKDDNPTAILERFAKLMNFALDGRVFGCAEDPGMHYEVKVFPNGMVQLRTPGNLITRGSLNGAWADPRDLRDVTEERNEEILGHRPASENQ